MKMNDKAPQGERGNVKVENGVVVWDEEIVPDSLTKGKEKDSIVRVEFGPKVRKVGADAFRGCSNLEEIVFEEGTVEIGFCAFADCVNLTKVTLPASIRSIGGGAFVGCERLADVDITPGGRARIELHRLVPFRGCVGRVQIERKIAEENACRGRRVLNELYGVLMGEGHSHVVEYAAACARFAKVDWVSASEDDLRELIYSVDNKIAHLGAYANCSMSEADWNAVDKGSCRMLCARIAGFKVDANFIAEQREVFNELFGGNKKVRFNRIVAALLPEQVVQIPGEDDLNLLSAWLTRNGFLVSVPMSGDSWFATGSAVRKCISAILPEKSIYENGAFCWFLAEALRGTNSGSARQERIKRVRAILDAGGLN